MNRHKVKQGFTIIEVVLVLAIAGLIFLMVFVAFPALRRNQRDSQRRQDLANFSAQLKNLSTNGIDVTKDDVWKAVSDPTYKYSQCGSPKVASTIGALNTYSSSNTVSALACYVLRNYTDNAANTDTSASNTDLNLFKDPNGSYYKLYISNGIPSDINNAFLKMKHDNYIVVMFNTKCDNSTYKVASFDNNPYAYTVRYKMESGDIYCQEDSLK